VSESHRCSLKATRWGQRNSWTSDVE